MTTKAELFSTTSDHAVEVLRIAMNLHRQIKPLLEDKQDIVAKLVAEGDLTHAAYDPFNILIVALAIEITSITGGSEMKAVELALSVQAPLRENVIQILKTVHKGMEEERKQKGGNDA